MPTSACSRPSFRHPFIRSRLPSASVPALGSVPGEGSLWFEALSFPQRLAFQHQLNLEAGECQQRISDLEESRRIIPSDLLFQPLKNGALGDEEPGAQGHLAGVGGVGRGPVPLAVLFASWNRNVLPFQHLCHPQCTVV